MKKTMIALLALSLFTTFSQAAMAQDLVGSIKEFKLIVPGPDADSNITTKTVSKTALAGSENQNAFEFTLKATSRTTWTEASKLLDVAAVNLKVNLESVNTFGSSGTGVITVFQHDGNGRGLNKLVLAASCSVAGNKKSLSCTSERLANDSFIKIELQR